MFAVITTGPASAPIDDVRRITNLASGEIGALLAEALGARGFETLLFRARGATHTAVPRGALLREFTTNDDLSRALAEISETRGSEARAFFHAAALSDYKVAAVRGPEGSLAGTRKICGNLPRIQLELEPAAKILPCLRTRFPRAWIVGWKYECEGVRGDAVAVGREQLAQKLADAIVVNGTAYGSGFGILEDDRSPVHLATKREVAQFLASRAGVFAKSDK